MDAEERRYRVMWSVIIVVGSLALIVGLYAFIFYAWSGPGIAGD